MKTWVKGFKIELFYFMDHYDGFNKKANIPQKLIKDYEATLRKLKRLQSKVESIMKSQDAEEVGSES